MTKPSSSAWRARLFSPSLALPALALVVVAAAALAWPAFAPPAPAPSVPANPAPPAGAGASPAPEGTEVGQRLPAFSVTGLDGERVALQDARGHPVIVQGFASWCASCALDAQAIARVTERFPDARVFSLDIQPGEAPDQVRRFVLNALGGYPASTWVWGLYEPGIAQKLRLVTLDTTFVLDRDGVIVYKDLGITRDEDLARALQRAS